MHFSVNNSGPVILSGGIDLGTLIWNYASISVSPAKSTETTRVLSAKLPSEVASRIADAGGMQALIVDDRRWIHARFPNANPEEKYFPQG